MNAIPDFTPEELKAIAESLQERYGETITTEQADIELRLSPNDSQVTECPAVYWEKEGCHFIIAKTDEVQYFSQFFYAAKEQFGTGKPFYTDLLDCVMTTLRVQADHELQKLNVKDLNK